MTSTTARYLLATQRHGNARRTFARFDTFEAAKATADALVRNDGMLVPNAPHKEPAGYEYERGIFDGGNLMAVVYQDTRFVV